jgi:hypothetical protein
MVIRIIIMLGIIEPVRHNGTGLGKIYYMEVLQLVYNFNFFYD